jgi:pimeloyl-ACP methyl ester carboxylesterase
MLSRLFPLLALLACALIATAPVAAQAATPSLRWTDCPFKIPYGETEGETLVCGTLMTSEDHFAEDGKQVELAFVILYGLEDPAPDPVLYLEGGPGGSALSSVDGWVESIVRQNHDLILLDQRGTGYSLPSLNCIEMETDEGGDLLTAEQTCIDRFVEQGINLNAYNSAQSAADVSELMTLLQQEKGYQEYNLLGISYGTRLALTMLRDNPKYIRSVILDSVYPPLVDAYEQQALNNYRSLRMLFDGCAADPDCHLAYPNLEVVFYDVHHSLNREPGVYEAEDWDTGEVFAWELTGDNFLDLIVSSLYSTTAIPELPLVIDEVSNGNYAIVDMIDTGEIEYEYGRSANRRQASSDDDLGDISDSEGMFDTVECKEEVPFNNLDEVLAAADSIPELIRESLLASVQVQFMVCELYGLEPSTDIETAPVNSGIPTLVLAGTYDPITPPADAQLAASTLSRSYYFEFPGYGHGITDGGECADSIVAQFLEQPYAEPDGSCIGEISGPDFIIR